MLKSFFERNFVEVTAIWGFYLLCSRERPVVSLMMALEPDSKRDY
jgi:hypothetical protein